jgi:hypothetical protein
MRLLSRGGKLLWVERGFVGVLSAMVVRRLHQVSAQTAGSFGDEMMHLLLNRRTGLAALLSPLAVVYSKSHYSHLTPQEESSILAPPNAPSPVP